MIELLRSIDEWLIFLRYTHVASPWKFSITLIRPILIRHWTRGLLDSSLHTLGKLAYHREVNHILVLLLIMISWMLILARAILSWGGDGALQLSAGSCCVELRLICAIYLQADHSNIALPWRFLFLITFWGGIIKWMLKTGARASAWGLKFDVYIKIAIGA